MTEFTPIVKGFEVAKATSEGIDFRALPELIGFILEQDFKATKAEGKARMYYGVTKVDVSPILPGRFAVVFNRIQDTALYKCSYIFHLNPTDLAVSNTMSVYDGRRGHLLAAIDSSKSIETIGCFDEVAGSRESHLKKVFEEKGVDKFAKAITTNDRLREAYNSNWDGRDPIELIRQGKITIDHYLEKGIFICDGYDAEVPESITKLRDGHDIAEIWVADTSFGYDLL